MLASITEMVRWYILEIQIKFLIYTIHIINNTGCAWQDGEKLWDRESSVPGKEADMKTLERARADLAKAEKKRDLTKKKLEADEYAVKECEAALMEAENNEYVNEIREWGLTVEELREIRRSLQKQSLAKTIREKEDKERNDKPESVEK